MQFQAKKPIFLPHFMIGRRDNDNLCSLYTYTFFHDDHMYELVNLLLGFRAQNPFQTLGLSAFMVSHFYTLWCLNLFEAKTSSRSILSVLQLERTCKASMPQYHQKRLVKTSDAPEPTFWQAEPSRNLAKSVTSRKRAEIQSKKLHATSLI